MGPGLRREAYTAGWRRGSRPAVYHADQDSIMPGNRGNTTMSMWRNLAFAFLGLALSLAGTEPGSAQTKPEGEMRFAVYVTIAPAWLDPGETGPGNLTPF